MVEVHKQRKIVVVCMHNCYFIEVLYVRSINALANILLILMEYVKTGTNLQQDLKGKFSICKI
uniref:Uncharacterized protein n=1 Tax=Octopus bimaculoides TaxID=37653 RepID=A0A0L8FMK5_OCTBM